jgi:hypothetical protein
MKVRKKKPKTGRYLLLLTMDEPDQVMNAILKVPVITTNDSHVVPEI